MSQNEECLAIKEAEHQQAVISLRENLEKQIAVTEEHKNQANQFKTALQNAHKEASKVLEEKVVELCTAKEVSDEQNVLLQKQVNDLQHKDSSKTKIIKHLESQMAQLDQLKPKQEADAKSLEEL